MSGTKPNRVAVVSSVSSGPEIQISEINEIFATVKDNITILMQTSIIIRNATPRDRYIKAQSSTNNPFLDSFDIAHVGHKFPKVDSEDQEWLKRRLGKAIAQRRQFLKYCREHHDKFSQSTHQDQPNVDVPVKRIDGHDDVAFSGDGNLVSGSREKAGTIRSVPTSALAPTDASTLHPSRLEVTGGVVEDETEDTQDDYSQTSYATSIHDGNASESKLHPPSLRDITSVSPFLRECPYCWTLQKIVNEKLWRYIIALELMLFSRPDLIEKCLQLESGSTSSQILGRTCVRSKNVT